MTTPDIATRRVLGACAALVVGALTLTACGGSASADDKKDGKGGAGSADTSVAKLVISAKDGSSGASINSTGVKVSDGKLTEVKMTVAETGAAVPGAVSGDGGSWKPKEQLERGTKYRITARAKDADGRTAAADSVFTTVSSKNSFVGTYTPDGGSTVGVGMPVSFTLPSPSPWAARRSPRWT
ncbi:Ig-like domain-containing protein [Streptomyces violaceorubidus]